MLPAAVHIYVAAEPVDPRRGFDGLAAATRSLIRLEPLSGHVFPFLNRRRNRIKLLVSSAGLGRGRRPRRRPEPHGEC